MEGYNHQCQGCRPIRKPRSFAYSFSNQQHRAGSKAWHELRRLEDIFQRRACLEKGKHPHDCRLHDVLERWVVELVLVCFRQTRIHEQVVHIRQVTGHVEGADIVVPHRIGCIQHIPDPHDDTGRKDCQHHPVRRAPVEQRIQDAKRDPRQHDDTDHRLFPHAPMDI